MRTMIYIYIYELMDWHDDVDRVVYDAAVEVFQRPSMFLMIPAASAIAMQREALLQGFQQHGHVCLGFVVLRIVLQVWVSSCAWSGHVQTA